jgi:hypothetical protein
MNPLIQNKTLLIACVVACFGVFTTTQAVVPPPDGGYPGFNTAEGQNALKNLTMGSGNTAVGWYSLFSATTASSNTGLGAGTLALNSGDNNTAAGVAALLLNTTGASNTAVGFNTLLNNNTGASNTGVGAGALISNTFGSFNTATGAFALFSDTSSGGNTATGYNALFANTSGTENTATGIHALENNTIGMLNTATGTDALAGNATGNNNTATGGFALWDNTTGNNNTALGASALFNNMTGSNNIALGATAGTGVSTASNVICIGIPGANVNDSLYVANVFETSIDPDNLPVYIDFTGRLGTQSSSRRFKDDITSMEKASEALLSLRPVTFHYKNDVKTTPQFGLIAEEVAKVNPALVVPDKEGKPYSVRYDQVNAMLLNEFLKEHQAFLEEQCKVERLEKQVAALTAGLQKVTAQLATTNGAAGMRSDIDGPSREAGRSGSEQVNPSLADSR